MMLKTYHLIYDGNEIVSITQVEMKDTDNNTVFKYDVRFIDGSRDILDLDARVETIRK